MHLQQLNYLLPCLCWLLVLPLEVHSQDSLCPESNGLPRKCVDISQCPPLHNLQQQYGNAASNYLRSRSCDASGNIARICCPTKFTTPPTPSSQQPIFNVQFDPKCYQTTNQGNSSQESLPSRSVLINLSVPWMALLGYRSSTGIPQWKCGGTLISPRHVLTTVDCVQVPNLYLVHLGSSSLNRIVNDNDANVRTIVKSTIHPGFKSENFENNIAVLKLDRDIVPSELIKPACLPIRNELYSGDFEKNFVEIIGWEMSLSVSGALPLELESVLVPMTNLSYCQTFYARKNISIDHRYFCGEYNKYGPNRCNNDNGGPVQVYVQNTQYVIGMTVYDCTSTWYPEIAVKVSEYLDFILQEMMD